MRTRLWGGGVLIFTEFSEVKTALIFVQAIDTKSHISGGRDSLGESDEKYLARPPGDLSFLKRFPVCKAAYLALIKVIRGAVTEQSQSDRGKFKINLPRLWQGEATLVNEDHNRAPAVLICEVHFVQSNVAADEVLAS